MCIEFNPSIPNDVVFVQEATCAVHKGSSLLAIIELGTELGYSLACTTTFNGIFVHNDLFHLLDLTDNSITALHSTTMVTSLFQTYEGELILVGPKKLIWHKIPINPQKLQVLPKRDRKFPFSPMSFEKSALLEESQVAVVRALRTYCEGRAALGALAQYTHAPACLSGV